MNARKRNRWIVGFADENGFGLVDLKNRIIVKTENFSWSLYKILKPFEEAIISILILFGFLFLTPLIWFCISDLDKMMSEFLEKGAVIIPPSLILILILSFLLLTFVILECIIIFREMKDFLNRRRRRLKDMNRSQRNEWHACEHKLIWLLEEGKEVDLENLKRASSVHPRCGGAKKQKENLAEPSLERLEQTQKVGQEYYKKLAKRR